MVEVETPFGKVRMKVSGPRRRFAPEYEDCRALADATPERRCRQVHRGRAGSLFESQEMKYYLTTPIYYANAAPHIGHAYTTIAADTIKRWKRMQGYDVVLTTGTDEHGQKIERAAAAAGKTPQEFTDIISAEFREQWQILGLDIDRFQRTTSRESRQRRCRICSAAACRTATSIKATTPGSIAFSMSCTSTTPSPAIRARNAAAPPKRSPKRIFTSSFRRSRTGCWSSIEKQPDFILPETRRNEVLAFVKKGLSGSLHQPHHASSGAFRFRTKRSTSSMSGSMR